MVKPPKEFDVKYGSIEDALAGMIDQLQRGVDSHEYELHLKRLKRYNEHGSIERK